MSTERSSKETKELNRLKKQSAIPAAGKYLLFVMIVLTVVYIVDEITSNVNAAMQPYVLFDLFGIGSRNVNSSEYTAAINTVAPWQVASNLFLIITPFYKALSDKYLVPLRTSGSAVIVPLEEQEKRYCDTLVIRDTIVYLPDPCPKYEEPVNHDRVWALKTNFLLWGLAAPNVQIELPLGSKNKWSIEGEVFWPWWIWSHSSHAHQCGNVGLELKRWLGNREKRHLLDGWHLGLGVAAGYYDFEWEAHKGYQGEYLNVYGNIGYQHRFGKRKQWAVDGGIAIGWIPTKYREYLGSSVFPVGHEEEYDDHLMWQKSSSKNIFGATHANISLAYLFYCKKKNKDAEETTEIIEPTPVAPTNYLTGKDAAEEGRNIDAKAKAKAEKKAAKEAAKAEEQRAKDAAKADEQRAKEAAKANELKAKSDAEAAKEAEKAAKAKAEADEEAAKAKAKADEEAAKAKAKNKEPKVKEAKASRKRSSSTSTSTSSAARVSVRRQRH